MSKHSVLCLSLLMVGLLVGGCTNTFHGAGRDMEDMGEWVQDTF